MGDVVPSGHVVIGAAGDGRGVRRFGLLADGREVRAYRLGQAPGVVLEVLDLGATVHRLEVTGGDGMRRNVCLGHATPEEYLTGHGYIGGTIGRFANRIAGGRFPLEGRTVRLGRNDRGNTLHGGPDGFHRRMWTVLSHDCTSLELRLVSPDGDQGFPGSVTVTATFAVQHDTVTLVLRACSEATTVVNLTQHLYLNLEGEGRGTADRHLLQVEADEYLPVDPTWIPVGPPEPVTTSTVDLRRPREVGSVVRILRARDGAAGLDHTFLVRGTGHRRVAVLSSRCTATAVSLFSDQPTVQVYSAGDFDGTERDSAGRPLARGAGIALEPQGFPNAPNRADFPSTVLRAGEEYTSRVAWIFGRC